MKPFYILILATLVLLSGCASPSAPVIDDNRAVLEVTFSFNAESYPWLLGTKYPQIAVWVTSGAGAATLFVTDGAAKNDWYFAEERPSALPVWYGLKGREKVADVDAVSGATPSGESYTITWPRRECRGDLG